jgi:hypothetical protein
LNYLKYLNERELCIGEYWDFGLAECARMNWIDILKYCHENIKPITQFRGVFDSAAESGNLDLVKYLNSIESICSYRAMDWAAKCGRMEMLEWLHSNRSEGCTTGAMDSAAEEGNFEIVKWLHFNRKEGCTKDAMDWAAEKGHLEIVKW